MISLRNGQWVKLRLKRVHEYWLQQEAFCTRSGDLVAIFVAASPDPNGMRGSVLVPARFVLVNADGTNFTVPAVGQPDVLTEIWVPVDGHQIESVQEITDDRDLPPGRIFDSTWLERLHCPIEPQPGYRSHLAAAHAARNGAMTPAQFLKEHDKALAGTPG